MKLGLGYAAFLHIFLDIFEIYLLAFAVKFFIHE